MVGTLHEYVDNSELLHGDVVWHKGTGAAGESTWGALGRRVFNEKG